MRIAHVITKGDVGGAQTHVVELAGAQLAAGHRVAVVAGSDGPALRRLGAIGAETVVVPRLVEGNIGTARSTLGDLRRQLEALTPDIVHCHSSVAGLLGRIAARRAGMASVYTAHGWPFQAGASLPQRMQSLLGEWVGGHVGGGVVCLTDHEAAAARRWRLVDGDRLVVIPNGLGDVAPHQIRSRRATTPLELVMVARFAPPKQQAELIEVLLALPSRQWRLTLVGDGPGLAACQAIAARDPSAAITFAGHRDDVADLLPTADVVLLWSKYEGMPISLLEAMRAGVACVASDVPGAVELLAHGAGQTAADARQLATCLSSLLAEPERCDRMGATARRRFVAEYSIDEVSRRVLDVYRTIVERRSSAPSTRG